MNWLQIRLFGPYFSSFSTNSYGYYSQMSQNLVSNIQIFTSALIVRQAARRSSGLTKANYFSLRVVKPASSLLFRQAARTFCYASRLHPLLACVMYPATNDGFAISGPFEYLTIKAESVYSLIQVKVKDENLSAG